MRKLFLIVGISAMAIAFSSCTGTPKAESTSKDSTTKVIDTAAKAVDTTKKTGDVYTCPMHPEVLSNKPGKCPKCGDMDLVKK
jgi:hypothetical protein